MVEKSLHEAVVPLAPEPRRGGDVVTGAPEALSVRAVAKLIWPDGSGSPEGPLANR
jgi:hypothetical protein